jgi:hypothetical protein
LIGAAPAPESSAFFENLRFLSAARPAMPAVSKIFIFCQRVDIGGPAQQGIVVIVIQRDNGNL